MRLLQRAVILLSIFCHCGRNDVSEVGTGPEANQWRIAGDIADRWDRILFELDAGVELAKYAGPGGWNDFVCWLLELTVRSVNADFADGNKSRMHTN